VLDLPLDRPRPGMPTLRGAQRTRVLAPALRTRLESLARSEGATLFMVLLAAYEVFLHRHSGQDDISVATPIAGRTLPELEPLIGFFANTLVLRGDLSGDPTFRQLVRRVREAALDAYSYQGVPLEKVVETLRPERHLAQNPLAQALFVLQNTPGSALRLPGARVTMLELETRTSRFDLELHVRETDEGLACLMIASADLFEEETVTRLLERFEVLLSGIVENPDSSIAELPLLSSSERRRLVVEWNETDLDIGPLRCIHEIIEEQAARTPEAPAVVGWQETLSYRELDSRASRLAARLRREGIGPEKIAAVCLDRTPDLVAALLAIWKSGGAYVPLDPSYPADRLLYMLEDSGASAVIVEPRIVPLLGGGGRPLIILGKEPEANSPEASGGPEARAHPENLAYVLYTSGSTGRPKGVAIEHRNTFAFIRWAETIFPPERLSGVFASTSVSFDLSIFELFLPLCSGGTVILGKDALDLGQHPARDRVTLVNTVPSAIAEIVRLEAMPASLQTVNLAGEPLSPELASNVYASGPVEDVYNLYGPTEATTYSTFTRVPRANAGSVTIGRPIANTQVYLLDARMQTAPIGVAGELCIGGEGVARGYLGRADLTAEKFVPDTFRGQGRLYRTGDLARYRSNGEIEYLGRRDGQVKIRGFRIETGEIESQIRRYPGVHEVAVAAHSQSGTGVRLVAYVVRKENATISIPELKRALKRQLPDPMIPAAFVFLDALPLTPNGKVDRRALPDPGSERPEFLESYTAPRDDTEIALASIWQSLLGLERVGVFDNFFELGGHSLLATQLISRVRDRFSVDLPLRLLFESPTVAELAAAVAHAPSARSGGRIVRQDRAGRPAGG
jgi:amino acid adenylation domain-containing protein